MLKQLATLCFLAAIAIPAVAVRRLTVDQLQQIVTLSQSMHRTDDVTQKQLSDVKLTARLTGAALQQLVAASPGPKTVQSLYAIADESAFLDPPPDQLSPDPAPEIATQKAIVNRTVDYVLHTLPALPNLTATRITTHFVDTMHGLDDQSSESRGGLFLTGTYRSAMAFRDGRETDDPTLTTTKAPAPKQAPKQAKPQTSVTGMSSWGEFGPILGVVLVDSAKGKLTWVRWQQQDGKPVAVFQFSVDRSVSHYQLNYCCETSMGTYDPLNSQRKIATLKPGYHGRLEIDPETGTILRILIEADLHPDDSIQRASMMVEYGPVKIGDRLHVCPTRSVATTLSRAEFLSHGNLESVNRLQLNDAQFVDYHRFGSESRLIAEAAPTPDAPTSPQTPAQTTPANQNAPTQSAPTQSEPGSPTPAPTPATNLAAEATPSAPLQPPANPAKPEPEKEIQLQATDGLPGLGADAAKAPGNAVGNNETGSFTLKVTTRSVDVGLVADDKHGKPVADLKQDDFSLFDNGRKQQLIAFRHATTGATVAPDTTAQPEPDTFTNAALPAAQAAETPDTLILLIDESHLAYQDLNQARGEMLRFLNASRTNSPVALYSISEQGFHILQDVTRDHALVAKKLASWTPDARAVAQAQSLDRRNRQQFDTVHSAKDLDSVNGNNIAAPETIQPADIELRQMGDSPLRYALEGLTAFARHFAPVPGRKILAWISGDSALADWEDQATGMDKGNQQLQFAFLHTREALNEAGIALYIVDASAVQGSAIDASLANRNVEVNPVDQQAPLPRDNTAGRLTAQMQQNTHAIQGPVRQLAEATGGRAFNHGSDLKATLDTIDRDAAGFYELAFDPDTPADGKFHALQVKVPARKDVTLRYRTGYLYTDEAGTGTPQQRLQQAVWSPQDATGIALTAEAVKAADSPSSQSQVKLRIALQGLAFQQKADHWVDNLYIFVTQRDDAAQKAEVAGDTMRLSLKQSTYETGMPAGIPYFHDVAPKSRLGSVRIIVIDGNSGKIGSVTLPSSALQP
jgi:VWFA-related protein